MAEAVRLLVVDDDPKICHLLEQMLTQQGYRVSACLDSNQVLALLKQESFGAVLLDIRMKGLEGTELLPIIKRNFPDLPVIIISAYGGPADIARYKSLGALEAVAKPFTPEELIGAVNRAVATTETIQVTVNGLALFDARDQLYRKLIVAALRKTNWNQVKAAALLGVSRYCLIRWLRKLEITY